MSRKTGFSQHLCESESGKFLKEVELLAQFNPVMEDRTSRIKDEDTRTHNLGQRIQSKLIQVIGDRVQQTIFSRVQEEKYYSLILDCTPDVSHEEQMSIVLHSVAQKVKSEVKGYFLAFEETAGPNLLNVILDKPEELQRTGLQHKGGKPRCRGKTVSSKHKPWLYLVQLIAIMSS